MSRIWLILLLAGGMVSAIAPVARAQHSYAALCFQDRIESLEGNLVKSDTHGSSVRRSNRRGAIDESSKH
jgi:hypothetical protein